MKCSHCGAEFEGNFCTACGAKAEPCPQPSPEIPADRPRSQKPKKPIYRKWWFYVIVAVVVIALAGRISGFKYPYTFFPPVFFNRLDKSCICSAILRL